MHQLQIYLKAFKRPTCILKPLTLSPIEGEPGSTGMQGQIILK